MTLRPLLILPLLATPIAAQAEPPLVVTDFAPTTDMVTELMAGVAAPENLLGPGDEPHHFSLKPSQARTLSEADIVVWVGPALTPWLVDPMANLASNAESLVLMDVAGFEVLPSRDGEDDAEIHGDHDDHAEHDDHEDHAEHDEHAGHENHAEHEEHDDHEDHAEHEEHDDHEDHAEHEEHDGHEDHAEHEEHDNHEDHAEHDDHAEHAGHNHGPTDPHGWLDPANVSLWAAATTDALIASDADNANAYRANLETFQANLTTLGNEIDATLAGFDASTVIFPHDSFQYLEARIGQTPAGFISDSEDADPGARHLTALREKVTSGDVTCVLYESDEDIAWAELLVENTDAKLAIIDMIDRDSVGYEQMMRNVAQVLTTCEG